MALYKQCFFIVYLLTAIVVILSETNGQGIKDGNCTLKGPSVTERSKLLSRRKRFLTFPDGSSFQLVFCVQTSALIAIGDIFLFGNTAALAWALPSDSKFFHDLKKGKTPGAQSREDTKYIHYVGSKGESLGKVPYKRRPIINPAFAKRSIDDDTAPPFHNRPKRPDIKSYKKLMHAMQLEREFLKREHMDDRTVEFHRHSRVGLFEKLEKLFTGLGAAGRQCVLRQLCEAAQLPKQQKTFLEEILRVVFTLPKGEEFEKEHHREYDKAHFSNADCSELYPECEDVNIFTKNDL